VSGRSSDTTPLRRTPPQPANKATCASRHVVVRAQPPAGPPGCHPAPRLPPAIRCASGPQHAQPRPATSTLDVLDIRPLPAIRCPPRAGDTGAYDVYTQYRCVWRAVQFTARLSRRGGIAPCLVANAAGQWSRCFKILAGFPTRPLCGKIECGCFQVGQLRAGPGRLQRSHRF
jgi:hypothetical protein